MFTFIILIGTAIISYIAFNNRKLFFQMQFNAYQIVHRKEYRRLITGVIIHADWGHLFFNMFAFFFFGQVIERDLSSIFGLSGSYHFLILYFGAGFVSSLPALLKHKDNIHYNAVGASGAVSAIIYAFILLHPLEFISVFFIPMPAILFGVIYLAISYYMAKKNVDNIGHDAHFWGAVFGFIYPILIKPELFMIFLSQLKF